MTEGRPLARAVVAAAILLLGGLAAWRLPLSFLPETRFPELSVSLRLPDSSDPLEVSRQWIVPLESAIRSLGDVRGIAGQVSASGGFLRVRFAAGTDPERKASRLESELTSLRRQLPRGAVLQVAPASSAEGDLAVVVWLGQVDDSAAVELAERLRAVHGVRRVQILGRWPEEIRVQLRPRALALATPVRDALSRTLERRPLGDPVVEGRHRPLQAAPLRAAPVQAAPRQTADGSLTPSSLARLPIVAGPGQTVPLGALADIQGRRQPPGWRVHYQGQEGMALQVWREADVSPLLLEHRLRAQLGPDNDLVYSEAEPLRALLSRLGLGLLLASCLGALLAMVSTWKTRASGGTRRARVLRSGLDMLFAGPLALAAALNLLWLARLILFSEGQTAGNLALDILSLPALILGVCTVLPMAAWRLARQREYSWAGSALSCLLSAAALPIAVALASGGLGPMLRDAALTFLLGVAGGLAILPLLSPATHTRRGSGRHDTREQPALPLSRRLLQTLVRQSATVVLFAVTVAASLLIVFGDALDPRAGTLSPDTGELIVEVTMPEGSTLAEMEARVRELEARLDGLADRSQLFGEASAIAGHWSLIGPTRATLYVELQPRHRRPDRRRRMLTRLSYELAQSGQAVTVDSGFAGREGGALRFDDSLEQRPEADEDAFGYRFLLRSTDGEALRTAWLRTRDQLLRHDTRLSHIRTDWGVPSQYLELQPHPYLADRGSTLAAELRRRSSPPRRWRLPGTFERWLTLQLPGYPLRADDVPARAQLLETPLQPGDDANGEPVVVAAQFQTRERLVPPALPRRSGRFELTVDVRFPFSGEDMRRESRDKVHAALATVELPAGSDLERPNLSPLHWQQERLRLLGLALALPLLWLATAVLRLNSLPAGLAALAPATLGLAVATPWIARGAGQVDEFLLLSLAAALCAMQPAALEMAAAILGRPAADGADSGRYGGPHGVGVQVYRPLAASAGWWWWSVLTVVLVLAGPALIPGLEATFSAAAPGQAWRLPLAVAALAAGTSLATTATVLPALLLLGIAWRQRDTVARQQRRDPPAWHQADAPPRLSVRRLTKIYRQPGPRGLLASRGSGFQALRGVSFDLRPGIIGLLGPNGAGKTTLLRLLTGLLEPSRGGLSFHGVEVEPENRAHYRRRIGFLPQEFNAYPDFTAEQFLDYWALEKGIFERAERQRQIERLLRQVGLEEHAGRRVRDYSGGMRQRAGIARALLGDPPILIVDEPTTGLDIESRDAFRQALLAIAGERIILFSTHIASDVDAAASRILLLHRGRLRFDGPPAALVERARGRVFSALVDDQELRDFGHRYRVTARVRTLQGLRLRAVARPGEALAGDAVEPNLEEAYLTEIDRADTDAGRQLRSDRFAFLEERSDDPSFQN